MRDSATPPGRNSAAWVEPPSPELPNGRMCWSSATSTRLSSRPTRQSRERLLRRFARQKKGQGIEVMTEDDFLRSL